MSTASFQKLDRGEHERARAVGPGVCERQANATVGEELDPLLCQRRAQEIVTQALEPIAVLSKHHPCGVGISSRRACDGVSGFRACTSGPFLHGERAQARPRRGGRRPRPRRARQGLARLRRADGRVHSLAGGCEAVARGEASIRARRATAAHPALSAAVRDERHSSPSRPRRRQRERVVVERCS